MPTFTSTLQRLRPYEPDRERAGMVETGGQLALDIPRTPSVPAVRPSGPPLELRQVRAVLMVILEVHTGRRPASRLRALVSPRLYRQLSEANQVAKDRYALKTLHVCRVAPHAIEACCTALSKGRTYALVARFERTRRGWRCTLFDVVRPRQRS